MNPVKIETMILGRPSFSQEKTSFPPISLLKQNTLLQKLKPSSQTANKILAFIYALIARLVAFFRSKTNYMGIAAAFDRGSQFQLGHHTSLAKPEAISYLQKCLSGDEAYTPDLKQCLDGLNQQIQLCQSVQSLSSSMKAKAIQTYSQKIVNDLMALKPGQKILLLAQAKMADEVLYLFSKEEKGWTFKIIGRGKSMDALSGLDEVSMAGKAKIQSTIAFENIPDELMQNPSWLKAVLAKTMIGSEFETEAVKKLTKHLDKYKKASSSLDALATETYNFVKTLWTAVKQVKKCEPASSFNKQANRRFYIRTELTALFNMYEEVKYTLKADTAEYQAVESMFRSVSEEAFVACKKGYITHAEMDEIVKELDIIHQALGLVKGIVLPRLSQIKTLDMGVYGIGQLELFGARPPENIPEAPAVQAAPALEFRIPTLFPTTPLPPLQLASFNSQITDVQVAKDKIRELAKSPNLGKIVETIFTLEFSPYQRNAKEIIPLIGLSSDNFDPNPDSLWRKLTSLEVVQIIEQLNVISEWMIAQTKGETCPLETYECLLKINTIVTFLTSRHASLDATFETLDLKQHLKELYGIKENHFGIFGIQEEEFLLRQGRRMNPWNVTTGQDLATFCIAYRNEGNGPVTDRYKKQQELFSQIRPKFRGKAFFLPNNIDKWIRPLSHPFLLAAYRNAGIRIGEHTKSSAGTSARIWGKISEEEANRIKEEHEKALARQDGMKTQEAIVEDPEAVGEFLVEELQKILDYHVSNYYTKKGTLPKAFKSYSPEVLKALLLLLRNDFPQTEIIALLEKQPSLLNEPELCNFIDALFFNTSLERTLRVKEQFRNSLPVFLSEKINSLKASKNPAEIKRLFFLIEMNHKTMQIYAKLGYPTTKFNQDTFNIVRQQLEATSPHFDLYPIAASLYLKFQLENQQFESADLISILLHYNILKNVRGNPFYEDPHNKFLIDSRYDQLVSEIEKLNLSANHFTFILDSMCSHLFLSLPKKEWSGTFPLFNNGRFEIDLRKGTVKEIARNQIHTMLPNEVINDELFQNAFKGLNPIGLRVTLKEGEKGAREYLFVDQNDIPSRVEEKDGVYTYFKMINTPEPLEVQAASFDVLKVTRNKIKLFVQRYDHPFPKTIKDHDNPPMLPYIFDHGFFIDPHNPKKGYCVNEAGQLLFEVHLEGHPFIQIKEIIDCREGTRSEPLQVVCAKDLDHPVLQKLAAFEELSKMLVWGKQGTIKKVEFPRYGLSFELQGDALVCLDPRYKGYSIDLSATVKDRKGFPISLLLRHHDPERPAKLLVPESKAISFTLEKVPEPKQNSLLDLLKDNSFKGRFKFYSFMFVIELVVNFIRRMQWKTELVGRSQLDPDARSIPYFSVDLRPYTNEILCKKEAKAFQLLELANQGLKVGNYELAFEMVQSLSMKKKEMTKENIRHFVQFFRTVTCDSGLEAAVKLKLILKLKDLIGKDAQFVKFNKGLSTFIVEYTKMYMKHGRKMAKTLQLSDQEFVKCANIVKKLDLKYYQKHLFPYFMPTNQTYKFPIQLSKKKEISETSDPKNQLSEYTDIPAIAKGHCGREKIYTLEGFNPFVSDLKCCSTHFLPFYKILLEKDFNDPEFQAVYWSLELMAPEHQLPKNTDELLFDFLNTVRLCKEEGISLKDLPPPPAIEKQTKDESGYKFEQPIQDFLNAILPAKQALKIQLSKETPKPSLEEVPPYTGEDLLVFNEKMVNQGKKEEDISSLEAVVEPNKPLDLAELNTDFEFIENGPVILFAEKDMARYFDVQKIVLPDFSMPPTPETLSTCEKEALNRLNKALAAYKDKQGNQHSYQLKRNPTVLNQLKRALQPQYDLCLTEKAKAKQEIDRLIYHSKNPVEQAAIFAKNTTIATETELMLALMQRNLEGLKKGGKLPSDIDCNALQKALIAYYEYEEKLFLIQTSLQKIDKMGSLDDEMWKNESTVLYQLLTRKKNYSRTKHPELLLFSVFNFMTYRTLNNSVHQLQLLQNMLNVSTGITLAVTGAGKTKVLSLLRALMKANGKNLVTQVVSPSLYAQTLEIMEKILGDTFKTALYPLRFDLKMRLTESVRKMVKTANGKKEIVEKHSIFKSMYEQMLKTIKNRGCILTDYKSFPFMEEKFWKLTREMKGMRREKVDPSPMDVEHWTYLRKILILFYNRKDETRDEIDQHDRPIHRFITQMEKKPKKPAQFIIEQILEITDLLREEKDLFLKDNLQGEITETQRTECLERVARKAAQKLAKNGVSEDAIFAYLMGRDESVLAEAEQRWKPHPSNLDILAFTKDLFCTYLPLTLSYSKNDRYVRVGKNTEPAFNGERTNAKFGIIEELIYTVQDRIQAGVSKEELVEWIDNLKKDQTNGVASAADRFKNIFSDKELSEVGRYSADDLLKEVNRDYFKVRYFLRLHLDTLTTSGRVVSMGPQNCVSMSRAAGGISATLGCSDAYHRQFSIDQEKADMIKSEMVYRFIKRLNGHQELLEYDPHDPAEVLQEAQKRADICALIDGANAYKELDPKQMADLLKKANSKLKRVGFYNEDGETDFVGDMDAQLAERGFAFPKGKTRGADVQLKANGCAVLTVNNKGTMEELNQEEGRMRLDGQKVIVARSKFAPAIKTAADVVQTKVAFEARRHSDDLFRAKKEELYDIVRTHAKINSLLTEDLDKFLDAFDGIEDIFITPPPPDYDQNPGSYYELNKHIRKCDQDPITVLEELRSKLIIECEKLGLKDAITNLKAITYSPELLRAMPKKVHALGKGLETNLDLEMENELELDIDVNLEAEEELSYEQELESVQKVERDIPYYLPRLKTDITYKVQDKIHPGYGPKLEFTDSFLPLSRQDPLFKRRPFDELMYDIGSVRVTLMKRDKLIGPDNVDRYIQMGGRLTAEEIQRIRASKDNFQIRNVIIGDILDDTILNTLWSHFDYDIRTGKATYLKAGLGLDSQGKSRIDPFDEAEMQTILNSEEFALLIVQTKFLNGQVDGYSDKELVLLRQWWAAQGLEKMKSHFENEVLRNKATAARYHLSQLWREFNG